MSGLCPIEPCQIKWKVTIKVTIKFVTVTKKNVTTLPLQLPKKGNAVNSKIAKSNLWL